MEQAVGSHGDHGRPHRERTSAKAWRKRGPCRWPERSILTEGLAEARPCVAMYLAHGRMGKEAPVGRAERGKASPGSGLILGEAARF